MFTDYKAQAIVLEQEARGEADKRFTLFSKEFGRIEVMGKSIRKIDSKLKGGIALFSLCNIEFIQGRHYKILTFSRTEKEFADIKGSLNKLKIAYQIREIANKLIVEPEKDLQLWDFILATFTHLNQLLITDCELQAFYHFFCWRLLALLGRQPELFFCLKCRGKLKPKDLYFSMHGGILCQNCGSKARRQKDIVAISGDTIKLLREIGQSPFAFVCRINITKHHLKELDSALELYLS